MPTYQYACTECGHAFDQVQKFSDDALTVCPVCEGKLRKVYNAVGVVFKGSGFYRNDSRSGGTPAGDAPAKSDASSSSDSTSDSSAKPSPDKPSTTSDKPAKSTPAPTTTSTT